jgi:hypothetical protein
VIAAYWVLKVLGPEQVRELTPAMISELECVSGELCEPIDSYSSQDAASERALREHRRTGVVHKVTFVI